MSKLLIIAAKLALSGALIFYVFSKIDGAGAMRELRNLPATAIAMAVLLSCLLYVLAAVRLRSLLRKSGVQYTIWAALDTVVIGAFFGQTLISFVGGDAMRVWRITRQNVPVGIATRAVLLDRVLGFVGMIGLIILGFPLLLQIVSDRRVHTAILLLVIGAACACAVLIMFSRLPQRVRRHPVLSFASKLSESSCDILADPTMLWTQLTVSFVIQIINVGVIFSAAVGLGVNISLEQCLVLIPPVIFLSMMPISFAGWGVREGAMVAALATVGVPPSQSLAMSISYGLTLVVVSLPGGLLWFYNKGSGGKRHAGVADS